MKEYIKMFETCEVDFQHCVDSHKGNLDDVATQGAGELTYFVTQASLRWGLKGCGVTRVHV
eukprot:2931304-Pyramimonas_sp.AAC.1